MTADGFGAHHSFTTVHDAAEWLLSLKEAHRNALNLGKLEQFLHDQGEFAIIEFMSVFQEKTGYRPGPFQMPPIDENNIPPPGFSLAENGESFSIPDSLEIFEQERLRLMTKVAVQRALCRDIVVNVGIGYIGTANITAAANAKLHNGEPAYFVIGYQRPSTHSSWKVNFLNQGLPTITTADNSLAAMISAAHLRGNLTATFLQQQSLAVADLIFIETELHVRKYVPRSIERAEADPQATLALLEQIAGVMNPTALLVIESTVYPGFTRHDALPAVNKILRKRGKLDKTENANLAYGFHRVKPGPDFMASFYNMPRDAGGVTAEAAKQLAAYFQQTGINYQLHSDITAAELMKDIENAAKFGLLDLMSAFMKSAELTGIDGFAVIRAIARARPDEHGRYVQEIAGLQVGGYCVPKELGLLINGLQRHYAVSELGIREVFQSRLSAASVSDHRAEGAALRSTPPIS